jgi:hypothetical protein
LGSTHGIEQDEIHKKSIVRYIEQHVDSISAVLILANGPVQRIIDTDYTFSALSAILPNTLVDNTAFVFTNIWRFSQKMVPEALKNAPIFLFDNPIAHRNGFKDVPKIGGTVEKCEQRALEMLVKLFNWLDGLEPQPAMEVVCLYKKFQTIEAAITMTFKLPELRDREVSTRAEIDTLIITLKKHLAVSLSPCFHLALESLLIGRRTWMLSPTSRGPSAYPS